MICDPAMANMAKAFQVLAAERAMMARGCVEQARTAAERGFDPEEWLEDAREYQALAAITSALMRQGMDWGE